MKLLRPVWAEVSLENFKKNLETVSQLIGESTGILAVVKADGYGIGAVEAAKAALTVDKISGFAVATPEEALELRAAGIASPILVLGPTFGAATRCLVDNDISITVTSLHGIQAAQNEGASLFRKARVHLKVDTGMSRIGFRPGQELNTAALAIKDCPNVELEGVFTHFSAADTDPEYTRMQISRFSEALSQIKALGLRPKYRHAANSAAIIQYAETHLDLVRPGIMLYGSPPDESLSQRVSLWPVLSLKARISHVKRVPEGTYIGYGKTYQTTRESVIATLPVGYADGYPRLLSNRGSVLIQGARYPIVGRVCMDQLMVDLGTNHSIEPGQVVTLIGTDGKETITVDEVARLAQTISHEILTGIGKRVPRIYV